MNVADQEGSWRTGMLALVYLFPEMAVSNLVGGRVRPGALLDSVHVQLRNHKQGFYKPFHSQSLEMSASALPVPGTAGGGDMVDFSTLPSFSCPVSKVTLGDGPHCPVLEHEANGRQDWVASGAAAVLSYLSFLGQTRVGGRRVTWPVGVTVGRMDTLPTSS